MKPGHFYKLNLQQGADGRPKCPFGRWLSSPSPLHPTSPRKVASAPLDTSTPGIAGIEILVSTVHQMPRGFKVHLGVYPRTSPRGLKILMRATCPRTGLRGLIVLSETVYPRTSFRDLKVLLQTSTHYRLASLTKTTIKMKYNKTISEKKSPHTRSFSIFRAIFRQLEIERKYHQNHAIFYA